ncbi:MAG: redoxin domain-containing protein, partial [Candidatus Puniceispirillum sp.]|nr:redoxin domain-containing protein [Candidatus Puniceispirillum sp.]
MSLRINDIAPDFTAQTTLGELSFHEWLGDSWGVLFSHPKDFTPVCTTELGTLAGLQPEFEARNVKVIGLSVDPVEDHNSWLQDIADVTGHMPNYPIIADTELSVAKLYNMLPREAGTSHAGSSAVENQAVRSVFIIGPDKRIKLSL